ncbi:hypothetical protein FS842_000435 [Serendipita sp. 407]|nr:hypothetical protein FS842_000435 [Serendipita sp. 407]
MNAKDKMNFYLKLMYMFMLKHYCLELFNYWVNILGGNGDKPSLSYTPTILSLGNNLYKHWRQK